MRFSFGVLRPLEVSSTCESRLKILLLATLSIVERFLTAASQRRRTKSMLLSTVGCWLERGVDNDGGSVSRKVHEDCRSEPKELDAGGL
jgi:hypothetical protein